MKEIDVLKELFDERIIKILNLFLESPDKNFYLTEISQKTKINISTASRILSDLASKEFIEFTVIGKVRFYSLKKNQKTEILKNLISGVEDRAKGPIQEFINKIKEYYKVKKIVLENKNSQRARIILVGDYFPKNMIERICNEIKQKYDFRIEYIRVDEDQYKGLNKMRGHSMKKNIIWEEK